MKRPRVRSQGASPVPRDPRLVTDIITSAILSKPRMSINEGGRNHVEPLSAKHRREVASLIRKAHSLLGDFWRDENADHITDAGHFLKQAIHRLDPTKETRRAPEK